MEVLTHWGTLMSEIREETFEDPHDKEGTNRTGIYCAKVKFHQQMPEWLPLDGLRIKIQYHNIQRLCSNCYGKHLRKECTNSKKTCTDYVKDFARSNPDLPQDFYGKSNPISTKPKCPQFADYKLPTSQVEWDAMLEKMAECGIDKQTGIESSRKRKEEYEKTLTEYKRSTEQSLFITKTLP